MLGMRVLQGLVVEEEEGQPDQMVVLHLIAVLLLH
jgi:hypothetical protein